MFSIQVCSASWRDLITFLFQGSAFPSPTAAANYDPSLDTFDRQIPRIPAKRLGNLEEVRQIVILIFNLSNFLSAST